MQTIRGLRHLMRCVGETPRFIVFNIGNDMMPLLGVVLYVAKDINSHISVTPGYYLFNRYLKNTGLTPADFQGHEHFEFLMHNIDSSCASVYRLPERENPLSENPFENISFKNIYLLDDNFQSQYTRFCQENKSFVNALSMRYGILLNDPILKTIFAYVNGSKNFFGWAIKLFFKERIPLVQIKWIMSFNERYQNLTRDLKKKTITAYTTRENVFLLIDEMIVLRREKRIKDTINEFNTVQKRILQDIELDDVARMAMSRFQKLSPVKRQNFIRKMSTVDDGKTILREMEQLLRIHFRWDKNDFLRFLDNNPAPVELVWESGDAVLVRVGDYETIKDIAKSTNWCISKNKKYWNDYVGMRKDATQYVLLDFAKPEDDNYSIVGFTVCKQGITNAHDFTNNDILEGGEDAGRVIMPPMLFTYLKHSKEKINIFTLLDNYGIELDELCHREKFSFEWNKASFIKRLQELFPASHYNIISEVDNKVAVQILDNNIPQLFNKDFGTYVSFGIGANKKFFVFADFDKSEKNSQRLYIAGTEITPFLMTETCVYLVNAAYRYCSTEKFNNLLEEYHVPYDIISRSGHKYDLFMNSLRRGELAKHKECLKDESYIQLLKDEKEGVNDALYAVLREFCSPDYLNMIYESHHTVTDILGEQRTRNLITLLFSDASNERYGVVSNINDGILKDLEEHRVPDNVVYFLSSCQFLKMLISKEPMDVIIDVLKHLKTPLKRRSATSRGDNVRIWVVQNILERILKENVMVFNDRIYKTINSITDAKIVSLVKEIMERQKCETASSAAKQMAFKFL